jgi:hypothetical protein
VKDCTSILPVPGTTAASLVAPMVFCMKCNAMRQRMRNEHVYKYTYIYIYISHYQPILLELKEYWMGKKNRTCLENINQSAANDGPGPNLDFSTRMTVILNGLPWLPWPSARKCEIVWDFLKVQTPELYHLLYTP